MPLDFRVLVASADCDVLDLFSRRLVKLGCLPIAVTRQSQALGTAVGRHMHLALVTPDLEDGSGLRLASELSHRWPNLPILVLFRNSTELAECDEALSSTMRCVAYPNSPAALDEFLEDLIETACSSKRNKPAKAVLS